MNENKDKLNVPNDLKAKLLKELDKVGYPVELKVGNILSQNKWWVEHNRYYIDEDEQKGREIDILAHTNSYVTSEDLDVCVWCHLACEVKKSTKYPWVVLSTNRGRIEGAGYLRLHYSTESMGSTLPDANEIDKKATTKHFVRIGRSYFEGFKSPDAKSTIFEALTTAIKASEYKLKTEKNASENFRIFSREITFIDPIVVLDGQLFEAYVNDDNCIDLNQISHIPISFGYISANYDRAYYLVEIVTLEEFPDLLAKKRKWIDDIRDTIVQKLVS